MWQKLNILELPNEQNSCRLEGALVVGSTVRATVEYELPRLTTFETLPSRMQPLHLFFPNGLST